MTGDRPLTVGLVQINNSFSGQNYLPYSVGCLESYVRQNAKDPGRYRFLPAIYKRTAIGAAVDALAGADVVGFSLYVWNARISLEIARRLKARNPNMLIVVGGPHVPDRGEPFVREHAFIDLAVHGEGEIPFLQVLEAFPTRDWPTVNSLSRLDADGVYRRSAQAARMRSLSQAPSPFLSNVFKPIMDANPDEVWIGLWETNRGCPFQCTFCDWGSATATKVNQFEIDRLNAEIAWFAQHRIEYVFCCDANFGILPRDVEIAGRVAETKKRTGYPHALSVQNTKNATERAYATQKILSDAGLNKGVALSMQSIDDTTLKNIKRDNISLDTYLELQRRFSRDGVETYSDLILGLPGETYDSFADGVARLIETGQHNRIQFNNLSILPNAEMGDPAYIEKFKMETVPSEIINIHGAREKSIDDVAEIQQLVISTYSMPRADWRRARRFGWTAAFFYFDKIMQMPIMVAHHLTGISHRRLFEALMDVDGAKYPELSALQDFFEKSAAGMQEGGPEYTFSQDWLGIYWPMDEYAFIQLAITGRLDAFYAEARAALMGLIGHELSADGAKAVHDAFELNRQLICLPSRAGPVEVATGFDILGFCTGVRDGTPVALAPKPTAVRIDRSARTFASFNDWCREVVWWGNKKGAYLYTGKAVEKEIAGHY
jgi:tRNA A37 methylthiotransferase MiaB